MTSSPIRRAQLIAPFGVGAMITAPDGTAMITASLDGWFETQDGATSDLDLDEFRVTEWRLQAALKVAEFRLPPDYRQRSYGDRQKNMLLKVPFLRFPLWHFCPSCRALHEVKPHHGNRRRCPTCESRNISQAAHGKAPKKAPFMAQVPFVAMCESGHLEDFPWREWVHMDPSPTCRAQMHLRATGGASLAAQTVHCECGVQSRNLAQITEAHTDADGNPDTYLSSNLAKLGRYECRGRRPWLDDRSGEGCGKPLRGSLRASTSAYFAHVESAIYLPGGTLGLPEGLLEILEQPPLSNTIHIAKRLGFPMRAEQLLQDQNAYLLDNFAVEDVDRALDGLAANEAAAGEAKSADDAVDPQALRRPEYEVLRSKIDSKDLKVRELDPSLFDSGVGAKFSRLNLVDQLRETRVLYGFSRVRPDGAATLSERKRMLWQTEPDYARSWLPAYIVHGEGLYFEFDEVALRAWENRPDVIARARSLARRPERVRVNSGLADVAMVPRFVMLHTFAHLMINQLVFECGYSSASLRERLFCSIGANPMAGVLIYTAAGDSEGTMGGLVRMGKPGNLEPTIVAALDRAMWCSSDPVCMELGERGQGPGSMNLAACHACGLLPETACEVFNRFLDRALVIGTFENRGMGFMHPPSG